MGNWQAAHFDRRMTRDALNDTRNRRSTYYATLDYPEVCDRSTNKEELVPCGMFSASKMPYKDRWNERVAVGGGGLQGSQWHGGA